VLKKSLVIIGGAACNQLWTIRYCGSCIQHDSDDQKSFFRTGGAWVVSSVPVKAAVIDLDNTDIPLYGMQEGASSTASTTITAICRSTPSAAGTCCWRGNGAPTLPAAPARSRKWRASLRGFAASGARCASCCAPTRASEPL
jgi:hypothetical protein